MRVPTDTEWTESSDSEIVDWKRVRSAIEHENLLTNHRLTWLLLTQGFLFSAFALIFQASTKLDSGVATETRSFYTLMLGALAAIGIIVSLYLRFGLRAAQIQHDRLRDWWLTRSSTDHKRHPLICGFGFGWFTDRLPSGVFPLVFVMAWVSFGVIALFDVLKPYAGTLGFCLLAVATAFAVFAGGYVAGRHGGRASQTSKT